jgi:hypothetical protein
MPRSALFARSLACSFPPPHLSVSPPLSPGVVANPFRRDPFDNILQPPTSPVAASYLLNSVPSTEFPTASFLSFPFLSSLCGGFGFSFSVLPFSALMGHIHTHIRGYRAGSRWEKKKKRREKN